MNATFAPSDVTLRREIPRRAAFFWTWVAAGAVMALICGGFLGLAIWAGLRTGEPLATVLAGPAGLIGFSGLGMAVAMIWGGLSRVRRGDTVALLLAPEGFALPEKAVPLLPWAQVTQVDRTYGRGGSLRLFLDAQAAQALRPHGILRLYARIANGRLRDLIAVSPKGLPMKLDDLLALTRAYAAAHGGPQRT